MQFDWEGLISAIKKNPEGHERLTGRYYITDNGIIFVNAGQPKPMGATRIPSLAEGYLVTKEKLGADELAELLARDLLSKLKG